MSSPRIARCGFVGLLGPTNSGKSTLLNSLLGSKVSIVSPKPQTTRDRILGIKTLSNAQIIFVDTPGFTFQKHRGAFPKQLAKTWQREASLVDLSILIVDTHQMIGSVSRASSLSKDELPSLRTQCAGLVHVFRIRKLKPPCVVALNKIDLIEKKILLPVIAEFDKAFSCFEKQAIDFILVSARTGSGLDTLEEQIISRLPLGPFLYPKQLKTDRTESFLASEIIREKLIYALQDEMPYSVAVQIERWQQKKEGLVIHAVLLVEREGQKSIVIGEKGGKLKSIGQASRRELERIFGQKIYLDLFARVEENWTRSEEGLRRAGYGDGSLLTSFDV